MLCMKSAASAGSLKGGPVPNVVFRNLIASAVADSQGSFVRRRSRLVEDTLTLQQVNLFNSSQK